MILFNRNGSLISDLLTPTDGFNLKCKVSFFFFIISNEHSTFVTLAWTTKTVLILRFSQYLIFLHCQIADFQIVVSRPNIVLS